MNRRSPLPWLLAIAPLAACASAPPRAAVDLQPARDAVAAARAAGAAERAPDCLKRAAGYLGEAEAAAGKGGKAEDASWLSRLAVVEAQCAAQLSTSAEPVERPPEVEKPAPETERLQSKLKKADDEQRRLEDAVALLTRDLELTENEIIRLKAKLRGLDSKAEASSAIAEARILMKRYQEQRGRSVNLARCQELVERAEQQILDENYGAASFFAQKAQELLQDRRRTAPSGGAERSAPKKDYTVVATTLNIRSEPSPTARVVGKLKKGETLQALAIRGDWVRVKIEGGDGWVYLRLLR